MHAHQTFRSAVLHNFFTIFLFFRIFPVHQNEKCTTKKRRRFDTWSTSDFATDNLIGDHSLLWFLFLPLFCSLLAHYHHYYLPSKVSIYCWSACYIEIVSCEKTVHWLLWEVPASQSTAASLRLQSAQVKARVSSLQPAVSKLPERLRVADRQKQQQQQIRLAAVLVVCDTSSSPSPPPPPDALVTDTDTGALRTVHSSWPLWYPMITVSSSIGPGHWLGEKEASKIVTLVLFFLSQLFEFLWMSTLFKHFFCTITIV